MGAKNETYVTPNGIVVRSGLELRIATQLEEEEIDYEYESIKLEWYKKYPRAKCGDCGSREIYQLCTYTPDFILPNGVIIEVKGRLTARDRKILVGVRANNEDIDLRVCFDKNNRIRAGSTTRYADWAERKGFEACIGGVLPHEWLI